MDRITKAQLENGLAVLNDVLSMAQEPYASDRDANGRLVANAGTFVLDWAYGGVSVCRMANGGGQSTVSGRGTIREAHTYIAAMLNGIRYAKKTSDEKLRRAVNAGCVLVGSVSYDHSGNVIGIEESNAVKEIDSLVAWLESK